MKKEWNILAFFCKRTKRSHVLLPSLQKSVLFFAFFSVLCKRTLRSLRSFGSHKSPKTQKKNGKERNVPFKERTRKEKNGMYRTEKNAVPNPGMKRKRGKSKEYVLSKHFFILCLFQITLRFFLLLNKTFLALFNKQELIISL